MSQNKKTPQRTCVGCGEQKNKNDLLRIVREPDGNVIIDFSGRANGRGAYICYDCKCLERAVRNHAFNRSFKENISDEVYDSLRRELSLIEK